MLLRPTKWQRGGNNNPKRIQVRKEDNLNRKFNMGITVTNFTFKF